MRSLLISLVLLPVLACSPQAGDGDDDDDVIDDDPSCVCGELDSCCPSGCEAATDLDCPAPLCLDTADEPRDVHTVTVDETHLLHVEWTGSQYAVAWYDRPGGAFVAMADTDGTLLDNTVTQLDPGGLFPRAAYRAPETDDAGVGEIGVVYVVEDYDSPDPFLDRLLMFARLDSTGALIEGSRVQIGPPAEPEMPSVVWNPIARQWGVVWEEGTDYGVHFARFDDTGAFIDERRIDPDEGIAYLEGGNAIVTVNAAFTIVWSQHDGTVGKVGMVRIDGAGVELSRDMLTAGVGRPYHAAVAYDGSSYGVSWTDIDDAGDQIFRIHFALADRGGTFRPDTSTYWEHEAGHATAGTINWNGFEYWVAWWSEEPSHRLWVTRLGRTGDVREHLAVTDSRDPWAPYMMFDGCQHVIGYQDGPGGVEVPNGRLLFLPPATIDVP